MLAKFGIRRERLQGDRFDAVMNYVFQRLAYGFFGAETLNTAYKPGGYTVEPIDACTLGAGLHHIYSLYPWQITQVQLNLMDSHDTARTLWTLQGDESALRLVTLFQLTMPGAPMIYYGDEIGMTGANDDCRLPRSPGTTKRSGTCRSLISSSVPV